MPSSDLAMEGGGMGMALTTERAEKTKVIRVKLGTMVNMYKECNRRWGRRPPKNGVEKRKGKGEGDGA